MFVSYSHQDEKLIHNLGLLALCQRWNKKALIFWSDKRIATGELWDDRIRAELKRTDIALLLVSQSFLISPYCQRVEVKEFLKARTASGLIVFPVILSPCEWERVGWLQSTQVQPTKGTITTHFKSRGKRDGLFLDIVTQRQSRGRETQRRTFGQKDCYSLLTIEPAHSLSTWSSGIHLLANVRNALPGSNMSRNAGGFRTCCRLRNSAAVFMSS